MDDVEAAEDKAAPPAVTKGAKEAAAAQPEA